eukprot:gene12074-biopygen18452
MHPAKWRAREADVGPLAELAEPDGKGGFAQKLNFDHFGLWRPPLWRAFHANVEESRGKGRPERQFSPRARLRLRMEETDPGP